jgi:hypothetical protein
MNATTPTATAAMAHRRLPFAKSVASATAPITKDELDATLRQPDILSDWALTNTS